MAVGSQRTLLEGEFLYRVIIDFEKPQDIGVTPHGHRLIVRPKKGTFTGPRLRGKVLVGGGDWFLHRNDGVGELDVRDTYLTDDGHLIYVCYRGILDIAPKVMQRVSEGKGVDSSEYYFRTTPYFETGSDEYGWLNRIVTVGIGTLGSDRVSYDVYAIR